MQMIRLWTSGVFSATRMCSPSAPDMIGGKPSSPMAALASASRRSLNAGSTQARATTLAPLNGPISVSKKPITLSTVSLVITPFSISSASSALARAALRRSRSAS